MTQDWIKGNVKEAAGMAGVDEKTFRRDWVPQGAPGQVEYRDNGKTGPGRRIDVNMLDLQRVLLERTHKRAC